jgi:hypothetical protein
VLAVHLAAGVALVALGEPELGATVLLGAGTVAGVARRVSRE